MVDGPLEVVPVEAGGLIEAEAQGGAGGLVSSQDGTLVQLIAGLDGHPALLAFFFGQPLYPAPSPPNRAGGLAAADRFGDGERQVRWGRRALAPWCY